MSASPDSSSAGNAQGRVLRHSLADRLYHWLMALCVLVLMATAFLPILDIKFEWVDIHWMTGVLLTALVLFHIVRALLFQDWRAMTPDAADVRELARGVVPGAENAKSGKYNALQKLFHLGVALFVLGIIVSGLLMLLKIDTPFWKRNPYWFGGDTWGYIYAVHGLFAMAMVTMIVIHIYFALRPDEWHLTRSMLRGWITRKEYNEHFDSNRWKP